MDDEFNDAAGMSGPQWSPLLDNRSIGVTYPMARVLSAPQWSPLLDSGSIWNQCLDALIAA